MTDQLTNLEAEWSGFASTLTRRIERLNHEEFVFIVPADGEAADGLRIRQLSAVGWRLVGPRSADDATILPPMLRADRIICESGCAGELASTVVDIARYTWLLSEPDDIAGIGGEFVSSEASLPVRLGPAALRARIRDDLAAFAGGAPVIGSDAVITIPGADFPTSVAVSMRAPQVDIFARVITDLPAAVSAPTLARLLGPKSHGITLVISNGDLYAATFYPCDGIYKYLYLGWYLARWFEFLDDGLPALRQALGIDGPGRPLAAPDGRPRDRAGVGGLHR
ncbi:hypothetical protein ACQ7HM_10500 [Williamsia sp. MIQD14]|uniref:hypothetical protein n=1 Tax=Williamsia sp. MIQD14 TaxID=3425703 RepID=UPI003DA15B39